MMSNHSFINIFVMKFDQIHIHRICICTYKCVLIPALVYGDLNELIGLGDVAVMRLTLVVIFKLKLKIFYILHFLLNCEIVNVTRLHWWLDNIGSTYGWVLLDVTRPLWVNWVDWCDCHYPRPVLAFGYCRCLRPSVRPSVRPSPSLSAR